MRAHELGSVQQGKAFLGLQGDGLPAHLIPDFLAWPDLAFIKDFSEPDQRQAQVGEGSEVSGCTQGSLLVDYRQDVVVEHVQKPLNRDYLCS